MNSTIVSPGWIPAGRVMLCVVRLPVALVAPTKDNTGSAALAAGAGLRPNTASAATRAETRTGTSRVRVRAGT